jgi:hypothetical protein
VGADSAAACLVLLCRAVPCRVVRDGWGMGGMGGARRLRRGLCRLG